MKFSPEDLDLIHTAVSEYLDNQPPSLVGDDISEYNSHLDQVDQLFERLEQRRKLLDQIENL